MAKIILFWLIIWISKADFSDDCSAYVNDPPFIVPTDPLNDPISPDMYYYEFFTTYKQSDDDLKKVLTINKYG